MIIPNLFQKIKIIAFFAVVILAVLGLTNKALAAYYTSGNWTSVNLLSGEAVLSIDSFVYNLSAKPAGTEATIKFSQDNTNWYNSSGVLDGTDTLTTGADNTIDLSDLGWSTANFYYEVTFTSDETDTPVLDDISLTFTGVTASSAGSGDHAPPVRYDSQPTGILAENAFQVIISLTTNEPATCKYSTERFTPYYFMTNAFSANGSINNLFPHSAVLKDLSSGNTYNYYVKCSDIKGNTNHDDFLISFSTADVTSPILSNGQPSGTLDVGTTQTELSLTTNELATCRYSTTAGTTYNLMPNTFSTTGGTPHSTPVTDLNNGNTYNYYVRCSDVSGNTNADDFTISFSVAPSPVLFVVLTANPSSQASLSKYDLTAAVSGTAVGPISYYFYCNRSDSSTNINFDYNDEYFNITETSKTAKYLCDYPSAGTYTAKVIAKRGQNLAESRVEITITDELTEESNLLKKIQTKIAEIQQKINELLRQLGENLRQQTAIIWTAFQQFQSTFFRK